MAERLVQAGAGADLSYSILYKKFSQYLDYVHGILPDKYNLDDINQVKLSLDAGLCYGFSLLLIALPAEQWAKFYSDLLPIVAWDGSKEKLRNDKKLLILFERMLGELLWLQNRHNIFFDLNGESKKGDSLINLVTKNQQEIIFNFGFLLREQEIERILQSLKNIILPDNQISETDDIITLAEPYLLIEDKELATISGFELCSSIRLPAFNKENALNGSLNQASRTQFIR